MIGTKVLALLLTLSAVLIAVPALGEELPVVVLIEGRQESFDRPFILRGQLFVWVRDLERLGWGKVSIGEDEAVLLKKDGLSIAFYTGRRMALINKLAVEMPLAPVTIGGRTMVPLQFAARAFGYSCSLSQAVVVDVRKTREEEAPTSPDAVAAQAGIFGRVIFAGKPVAGVNLRLVGENSRFIPGLSAISDATGNYEFRQLGAGTYRVYAYIGDNPEFFNRQTDLIKLGQNQRAEAALMKLGRVLLPLLPKPGEEIAAQSTRVPFSWSPCPGAAEYRITILDASSNQVLLTQSTSKPSVDLELNIPRGKSYRWQVQALDAGGEFVGGSPGKGGEAWTFRL